MSDPKLDSENDTDFILKGSKDTHTHTHTHSMIRYTALDITREKQIKYSVSTWTNGVQQTMPSM